MKTCTHDPTTTDHPQAKSHLYNQNLSTTTGTIGAGTTK